MRPLAHFIFSRECQLNPDWLRYKCREERFEIDEDDRFEIGTNAQALVGEMRITRQPWPITNSKEHLACVFATKYNSTYF